MNRAEFESCLSSLAVDLGDEECYLDYSKKWIDLINRGGLFKLNNTAYCFFVELEMCIRKYLSDIFQGQSSVVNKDLIIKEIIVDEDILLNWREATTKLEDEVQSVELLHYVVDMWLTIRGFSEAGAWLEYYKQYTQSNTKGVCGLRKGLKRKHDNVVDSSKDNVKE